MQRPLRNALLLILLASLCLACPNAWAETGYLVLHVKDVQQHPVAGLQIGDEGDGGSGTTDPKGKARIKLAPQTTVKSWVSLQIEQSPPGKDWVMVSPWERRTLVPSFENESENFVEVVVVQRGDRAALESGTVLASLTAQINKANAPKDATEQESIVRCSVRPSDGVGVSGSTKACSVFLYDSFRLTDQLQAKVNQEAVAKQYGLQPEELDAAIRAWGAKTTDPYDAGLAALYARNYDKATKDLQTSLSQREEKLASDQKAVADAAFFLGQSLYLQGKYKESAAAYQRCMQLRPDDATVLNDTALSLAYAGDYAGAEPLYRRVLAIDEKVLGPDHRDLAIDLNDLAILLSVKGDYAGAEPLYRRALAIQENALGPDHPDLAFTLNSLAVMLYLVKGDYAAAEPLLRRALAIDEKALGPDHPNTLLAEKNLDELLQKSAQAAAPKAKN